MHGSSARATCARLGRSFEPQIFMRGLIHRRRVLDAKRSI
jgi:hypothetical protein